MRKRRKKLRRINQILVSKKLYVTPELRNKSKNSYTIFTVSLILLVIVLIIYLFQANIMQAIFNLNLQAKFIKLFNLEQSGQIEVEQYEEQTLDINATKEDIVNYNLVYYDNKKLENIKDGTIITNKDKTLNYSETTVITDYHDNKLLKNATIDIPAIKVSYPVVIPPIQNNDAIEKCLKFAPTKYIRPDLGEVGNYCIAGHNYRNSLFFSKVKNLKLDDLIQLTSTNGTLYDYKIFDIYTVSIDDLSCLSQDTNDNCYLTLITCTDDNKERLIVKAKLENKYELN